ncbi:MAG: PorV/PorQ family protein, partial [Candidatus Latescibacteria bacterium]|nr:PorV/PorQ family protein [Candidatus Latescibacterota bacterium]
MAKRFLGFLLLGLMCLTPAYGQDIPDTPDVDDAILPEPGQDIPRERRAQTGFKFLSVSPDARAAGMGDAYTAMKLASTAMFYNPASMAYFDRKVHVAAGQIKWIADVDYNMGSVAFSTNWGIFGLSMVAVDYGDFERTVRADTELGFLDVGTYSPSAWAFGLGYAKAITDRFSVGGNVRIAKQSLGAGPISLQGTTPVTKDFSEKSTIVDFFHTFRNPYCFCSKTSSGPSFHLHFKQLIALEMSVLTVEVLSNLYGGGSGIPASGMLVLKALLCEPNGLAREVLRGMTKPLTDNLLRAWSPIPIGLPVHFRKLQF